MGINSGGVDEYGHVPLCRPDMVLSWLIRDDVRARCDRCEIHLTRHNGPDMHDFASQRVNSALQFPRFEPVVTAHRTGVSTDSYEQPPRSTGVCSGCTRTCCTSLIRLGGAPRT